MKEWKWPFVVVIVVVVAAIVILFGLAEDLEIRKQLISYFGSIVPFVLGAAAGGAVGGSVGFAKGKGIF